MPTPKKYDHINFKPPQGASDAAEQGLSLRSEFGRGGTEVGVARARDLSNRKNISPDTIKRMVSYFARHEVDSNAKGSESTGFWAKSSNPSAGWIAWLLWGGNAGRAWANKVLRQINAADEAGKAKTLKIKTSKDALGDESQTAKFCEALHEDGYVFEKGDKISKEELDTVLAVMAIKAKADELLDCSIEIFNAVENYEVVADPQDMPVIEAVKILGKLEKSSHTDPIKDASSRLLSALGISTEIEKSDSPEAKAAISGLSSMFGRTFTSGRVQNVQKSDEVEERYVLGVVLEPNDGSDGAEMNPDTDGDIYNAEEVRKAAHWFMEFGKQNGLLHGPKHGGEIYKRDTDKIVILENFIAPIDFPSGAFGDGSIPIKKGTWLMGLRINDLEIWQKIRSGLLNGLSIGGVAAELPVGG